MVIARIDAKPVRWSSREVEKILNQMVQNSGAVTSRHGAFGPAQMGRAFLRVLQEPPSKGCWRACSEREVLIAVRGMICL